MALKSQRIGSRAPRFAAMMVLMAGALAVAGCTTGSTMGDHIPTALGGLPDATPQRPATPAAYPAVHDLPPPRRDTVLSGTEQQKLEAELTAARNRAAAATAKPAGDSGSP
jgi:hypothetical protein